MKNPVVGQEECGMSFTIKDLWLSARQTADDSSGAAAHPNSKAENLNVYELLCQFCELTGEGFHDSYRSLFLLLRRNAIHMVRDAAEADMSLQTLRDRYAETLSAFPAMFSGLNVGAGELIVAEFIKLGALSNRALLLAREGVDAVADEDVEGMEKPVLEEQALMDDKTVANLKESFADALREWQEASADEKERYAQALLDAAVECCVRSRLPELSTESAWNSALEDFRESSDYDTLSGFIRKRQGIRLRFALAWDDPGAALNSFIALERDGMALRREEKPDPEWLKDRLPIQTKAVTAPEQEPEPEPEPEREE